MKRRRTNMNTVRYRVSTSEATTTMATRQTPTLARRRWAKPRECPHDRPYGRREVTRRGDDTPRRFGVFRVARRGAALRARAASHRATRKTHARSRRPVSILSVSLRVVVSSTLAVGLFVSNKTRGRPRPRRGRPRRRRGRWRLARGVAAASARGGARPVDAGTERRLERKNR